jgi:histidine triad (HIT) family protein
MDNGCIFCRIIAGHIPSKIIFSDEFVTVFEDIEPVAPIHYLIVPNKHIESLNQIEEEDHALLGHLFFIAKNLAKSTGIDQSGYRVMVNTGKDGRQTVFHLHMHLIGGRTLAGRIVS